MKLTIGFSPCPNDTFIFDALVNDKIEKGEIEFDVVLEDVQTLNLWALEGKLDITKLSYGVWPLVKNNYLLLEAGSALGVGVGPLLISQKHICTEDIDECRILIPGEHTTAHMLFTHAFPNAKRKEFVRYDEIEKILLDAKDSSTAGVIIHENRFTYQDKGLQLISDLGDFWEKKTNAPIPLGGIVAKRSLDADLISSVNQLIKRSIEYSWSYFPALSDYTKAHAQEMSEEVMRKHIQLYVNEFSVDLGVVGFSAIQKFEEVFANAQQ